MPDLAPLEAMLAAGLDDCGLPLDACPGAPRPQPWAHGRPCDLPAAFSWGTAARARPIAERGSRAQYHGPSPDREQRPGEVRNAEVARIVAKHGGPGRPAS